MSLFAGLLLVFSLLGTVSNSVAANDDALQTAITDRVELTSRRDYRRPLRPEESTTISKLCYGFIVCEAYPFIEMDRSIVEEGRIKLAVQSQSRSKHVLDEMERFHASKPGHLPSALANLGENAYDFIAGPQYEMISDLRVCKNKWSNVSASFLFPWESHNAYHSMNDNLFSFLAQVYLSSLVSPRSGTASSSLYHFNRMGSKGPTTMFRLLSYILESKYRPAKEILARRSGDGQCVDHLIWGSSFKTFYRDSFFMLRSELYQVLRRVLALRMAASESPVRKPKVVIITRGGSASPGARKLSKDTEQRMVDMFNAHGAVASICCDFGRGQSSVDDFLKRVWDADICVGVHGAGLSNCVFARPGMVVLEFQTYHNFGFDSFMKIAHMAQGQYMMYDVRNSPVQEKGPQSGVILRSEVLQKLVSTAVSLWKFSQQHLHITSARLHPQNWTNPEEHLGQLHTWQKDYSPDASKVYAYRPPLRGREIEPLLYAGDMVVDFHSHHAYMSPKQPALLQQFLSEYLMRNDSALTVRDMNEHGAHKHARQCLHRLDSTEGQSNYQKGRANFQHIDGDFLYRASSQHQEVWIFFNPALFSSFPQGSVLGPHMSTVYEHCIQLPYFKFRLLTMPWIEHRGECDRNMVQRKRSGANDNQLLTRLIS